MSTKELQDKIALAMERWQKIEDASVASTGKVIQDTNNPLIRQVMEIIQLDSQMHHRVQQFIADSLQVKQVNLSIDELSEVWDGIEKHIAIEKQMVELLEETLELLKGRKMVVQEYLLNYLLMDERKHDKLLDSLDMIKRGLYPYG